MVFRALDTKLNRPVAIKFCPRISPIPLLADAFNARRRPYPLNHPHILTVHDVGEHEGRQYLVTEFVDGGTLKSWVSKAELKQATGSFRRCR